MPMKRGSEALRQTMQRKTGAVWSVRLYWRYFRILYQKTGSVAAATNAFMQKSAKDTARVDLFGKNSCVHSTKPSHVPIPLLNNN